MKLRPYQQAGAQFLSSKRFAYLADDMGLGKTPQALSALPPRPEALIVCQAVGRRNWAREASRWLPTTPFAVLERLSDRVPSLGSCVASYDFARVNGAQLAARRWSNVVFDEAQSVRSIDAARTRAAFGRGGFARSAAQVWWLSGTPIENHPGDLWLPLYFSGATTLTRAAFLDTYCEMREGPAGPRPVGAKRENLHRLRDLLDGSGMFLRRTKAEAAPDLPPRFVTPFFVDSGLPLESLDRGELAQLCAEKELVRRAFGETNRLDFEILADLQARAQSVSTLLRYQGLCKVPPAFDLVREALLSVPKVGVGFKHIEVGRAFAARLQAHRIPFAFVDGSTKDRLAEADRFQTDPACRVFLGQLRAAGTTINLTAASDVFVVETEWDPSSLNQFIDRFHRIGSTNSVWARVIILADDPLDECKHRVILRKQSEIGEVFA